MKLYKLYKLCKRLLCTLVTNLVLTVNDKNHFKQFIDLGAQQHLKLLIHIRVCLQVYLSYWLRIECDT